MSANSGITQDQVAHVAKLAHLDLSVGEIELYTSQLQTITEYISQLDEIDASSAEPTFQVLDGTNNVWREDEIKPGLSQSEALSQARKTHQGYFVVDAVLKDAS